MLLSLPFRAGVSLPCEGMLVTHDEEGAGRTMECARQRPGGPATPLCRVRHERASNPRQSGVVVAWGASCHRTPHHASVT
jgi:hypothetical protein